MDAESWKIWRVCLADAGWPTQSDVLEAVLGLGDEASVIFPVAVDEGHGLDKALQAFLPGSNGFHPAFFNQGLA